MPGTAVDGVGARSAVDLVVSPAGVDRVVAGEADDCDLSRGCPLERVVAVRAHDLARLRERGRGHEQQRDGGQASNASDELIRLRRLCVGRVASRMGASAS